MPMAKAWFSTIMTMCSQSRFDYRTRRWVYFLRVGISLAQPGLERTVVEHIPRPLIEIFMARRWETAASIPQTRGNLISNSLYRGGDALVYNGC